MSRTQSIFFMFLVLIIYQKHTKHKENTVHYKCVLYFWCQWCFRCSMYRYYQTLTLKRHPGGRSSWVSFLRLRPLVCMQKSAFFCKLPISSDFFRVKCPSRESAGKKEGSRIAPLKRIQNVSFCPFSRYHTRTSPLFCPLRRFNCPGGIKLYLKRKSPLRGFLGLIRAYCILRHRKRRFP